MKRRRRRAWGAASLLLVCAILLASCAKGEAHLTVHANGTADLDLDLSIDDGTLGLIGRSGLMDELADRLKSSGLNVRTYSEEGREGLKANRRFDLRDMDRGPLSLPDGIEAEQSGTAHFFYSTQHAVVTVDMDRLLESGGSEWAQKLTGLSGLARKLLQSQLDLDFALTAPIKPHSSNADETRDGGRTLVWHLPLSGTKTFAAAYDVPNVRRIAYAAGGLAALALIVALLLLYRRRKRKNR
ncbi:hypothetical protein [Cohnella zeiphila]|uniref:DUF3153 domain-containing protein n=1 Tax=Cohnella zeiphila TaxID=2761120 RepID=A0A7X0SLJ2_9BACL|nr:hypothetical protein [Cohnella zeiphila]MBB6729948.1 hypothetical protein [Cohnella zeiphila]